MNTRSQLLRGAALSGGSVLFAMAALLVVGKIATNALTPAEVAAFALILLVSDALNLLGSLGLPVALPKLLAAAPTPAAARATAYAGLAAIAVLCTLLALPVLLAAALNAPGVFSPGSPWQTAWPHLGWIAPLLVAGALRDTAMAALAGLHRYGQRALGIVASAAAQIVLAVAAVVAYRGGLPALLAATALAYALAVAWLLWSLRDVAAQRPARTAARDAVRFSLPLYANSLLNFVFQRVDTLLLALLLGDPAPVAIYEMAKRLPMVLSRALGALLVPFLPAMAARLTTGDRTGAARLLDRSLALTAFLGFGATFAAVLVQEPLLLALFSPEYLAATSVLGWLLGVMTLAILTGLFGQTLIALGKPGWVTGINVGTALLSVALNLLLIPRWGIAGAACAAAAAAGFSYAAQAFAVHRIGVPVSPRSSVLPVAFAGIAAMLLWGSGVGIVARGLAGAGFLAACFLAGVVRPAELRGLIRR
jgi:O-antigen/teichoic acid export membrane protein